jgi:iron complex outermembrane receptor protein
MNTFSSYCKWFCQVLPFDVFSDALDGFGASIATRYRSKYIGEVANFANERALCFVDADMLTDAQLSYAFSGNMFEGLQVLFQVNNLTNELYIAYSESKQRLLDYQEYGTQYLLGLNGRL